MHFSTMSFLIISMAMVILVNAQEPKPEDPCSREGGICVKFNKCPEEHQKPGLCPEQMDRGIDCCAVAPKDTCNSRGGECTNLDCGVMEQKDVNHNCPEGEKCCVWIF